MFQKLEWKDAERTITNLIDTDFIDEIEWKYKGDEDMEKDIYYISLIDQFVRIYEKHNSNVAYNLFLYWKDYFGRHYPLIFTRCLKEKYPHYYIKFEQYMVLKD